MPREQPDIDARLIWGQRLAWFVAPIGIALVVLFLKSGIVKHDGHRVSNLGLVGAVLSIFAGVFAIKLFSRRIESGGRWWATEPPRMLRYMRGLYLLVVVAGFVICLVWPFLRGWTPEEKHPYAAVYVALFLFGLALLASAERYQSRLEREWLEQRKADR